MYSAKSTGRAQIADQHFFQQAILSILCELLFGLFPKSLLPVKNAAEKAVLFAVFFLVIKQNQMKNQ